MVAHIIDSFLNWTLAVDWVESVKDWVGLFRDFFAIIAAIAAIRGLSTWRTQLLGKTKFDLAVKISTATIELGHEFRLARLPSVRLLHIASILTTTDDNEMVIEKINSFEGLFDIFSSDFESRYKRLEDAELKFNKLIPQGESLLSKDIIEIVEKINTQCYALKFGYRSILSMIDEPGSRIIHEDLEKYVYKIVDRMTDNDDDNENETTKIFNELINQMTDYLHPFINLKSS
jgi:hypothetical protein